MARTCAFVSVVEIAAVPYDLYELYDLGKVPGNSIMNIELYELYVFSVHCSVPYWTICRRCRPIVWLAAPNKFPF